MIRVKCPVCGQDSYYRSTSFDVIRLIGGEVAVIQCGHEVRALGKPSQPEDPDAPFVKLEVFAVGSEEE